jgi:hypothetical protein
VSLIGYPDLDRPLTFGSGRILRSFGGGPYLLEPSRYGVLSDATGLQWHLELVRALVGSESRAWFACTVGAEFDSASALATVRELDPAGTLSSLLASEAWFRILPTPALATGAGLTAPVPLASSGLGTGRLLMPLPIESGLLLESALTEGGALQAVAEVSVSGVSPRVPAVVRFDPATLLAGLRSVADVEGALPYAAIVAFFRQDLDGLPLEVSGTVDATTVAAFAETMADRVVERFGRYVPAQDVPDAPVVALADETAAGSISWSLSQAVLTERRRVLPVDLLSAARAQLVELGVDSLVDRRDLADLPPLGQHRVTVLATLPASRGGGDVLGVTLAFPPRPPDRPQARTVTAQLDTADVVRLDVRLAPGEPLCYRYTPFAVVTDSAGARQVEAPARDGAGEVLRLSPADFPVELVLCEATVDLARLAVLSGVCTWEVGDQVHERGFTLDSGRLAAGLAVPRERDSLRIDVLAVARDGSGQLALGPFEASPVRLDLGSFPAYGPRQAQVRCEFDDAASVRAVNLLPLGEENQPENTTTVALTPADATATYRWFARSPFAPGYRYRPHDAGDAPWTVVPAGGDLVLRSSELATGSALREIAVRPGTGLREVLPRPPRPATEAGVLESAPAPEAGVVPVAVCPVTVPTDDLVYSRVDDGRSGYVPRYALDVQTVSGQQRYRVAMAQGATSSTLTVHLVAARPPATAQQAPDATELAHQLVVALDFLVSPAAGARKTLEFTDVTRTGPVVTAVLTFATLAERDDVYSALVDRERQARLLVHRYVDLLVPTDTPSIPTVVWPPASRGPLVQLPDRPAVEWPPQKLIKVRPPVDPIFYTKPPTTIDPWRKPLTSPLVTDAGADLVGFKQMIEAARVPAKRVRVLPAILTTPADIRPVDLPILVFYSLPTPQLAFTGLDGDRGLISITNWSEFSDDYFAASPELPPCGQNTSASRTWVDIEDADSGARIYGFCGLGSAQHLKDLSFPMPGGSPANVRVRMTDRSANVERVSNAVATGVPEPPAPPTQRPVRQQLDQTVAPEPFAFSEALHGYIFSGVTPRGGDNQLIRHRIARSGRTHTYLQDASRPWVVYVVPDEFKIARRPDPPYSPFATVRVRTAPGSQDATVVFDYVVAPHTDGARLADARTRLLADPRFGADRVEFQPLLTSDVRFAVDRPTVSGAVREERPDAALVLQGWLKDTLSMPLGDFRLLFDAMHRDTASMFLGQVEIDVPNGDTEVIPFTARMDDLEGPVFVSAAVRAADGSVRVQLTNAIESPVDVQTLDPVLRHGDTEVRAAVREGLPHPNLRPGEIAELLLVPAAPLPAGANPEVVLGPGGIVVKPDREAIWDSILDRSTVEYYRLVSVRAIPPSAFEEVGGREGEQVHSVVVEFEGGGTIELTGDALIADARVDYPIDDVVLGHPVSSTYRYTVTVVRANGDQKRDDHPRQGTSDILYVSVTG